MDTMYINPSSGWNLPKLMSRDMSCDWIPNRIQNWSIDVKADVFFLGVPFDYAVNYRPGTRFGPKAIREALAANTMYVTDRREDLSNLTLVDVGDLEIDHNLNEDYDRIYKTIKMIDKNGITIILGGDHSITRPSINAVAAKMKPDAKIGLIVFDAHFDSRVPVKGKEHSGHWLRQIQEDMPNKIQGNNIAIIGLSAGSYGPKFQEEADESGILSFTVSEVRRQGIDSVIEQCLKHVLSGTEGIYVSADIDVIHQAFAPGTSVPNPNGIYPDVLLDGLYRIGQEPSLLGFDITEVNPLFDISGITANIGAQAILNLLAGVTRGRNIRKNDEKQGTY